MTYGLPCDRPDASCVEMAKRVDELELTIRNLRALVKTLEEANGGLQSRIAELEAEIKWADDYRRMWLVARDELVALRYKH